MVKIDKKDRKIMYQLDLNSRQSLTSIGKKVGLPKNVVLYRINKLEKKGIIKNYYTVVDVHKLGYNILRFYFTYQYTNPDIKREIIDYFKKSKYTTIIHHVEGPYELVIYVYTKNLNEFYPFWQKTLVKYRDYFATQQLALYHKEIMYDLNFLTKNKKPRKTVEVYKGKNPVEIDDVDYKILTYISADARMSAVEIAEKLDVTTVTVANRIKKLVEEEIIQWFRTNFDLTKIGYRWYKVDIDLKDHKKIKQIIEYLSRNPNFVGVDRTLGYKDLEIEFYLKNVNEVHEIMEDLSLKFPNTIRNYKYVYVVETYRYHFFPPE
jgi:DNA-binding Lrp family transcriptional regulator